MKNKMVTLLAGAMLMMGMAVSAHAFQLTISSGDPSNTQTIVDNTSSDLNSKAGTILWFGSVNGISINFASGSETLTPTLNTFDFGSLVVSGGNAGQLITFDLSNSNLSLNAPLIPSNVFVTQGISATDTNTASQTADKSTVTANTLINSASVSGTSNIITGTNSSLIDTYGLVSITDPTSFSLDQIITITFATDNSQVSLDGSVQVAPVPEPGTVVLLGIGMLGLAFYGKRRMSEEA